MSNGVKASNASSISIIRRRSVALAGAEFRYWVGRFVRLLSGNKKNDPTSPQRTGDLFSSASIEEIDEIARHVHTLVCAIPDNCTQEEFFSLTRKVVDCRDQPMSQITAGSSGAADRKKGLQSIWRTLDSEARMIVWLHAYRDKGFREIAQLLNLPERHVLKAIRMSYPKLGGELLSAAPSRESTPQ